MYLKSLELSGFKSFAKKSALSFNSAITGIVGPNGSGKSNVAEAFRFVLGEQSIKSLRGKRGEDLIWNGGGDNASGGGRANRAGVKLTFDNSRQMFPAIDFDEVTVERVVHRDNSNEYLLNGSQVRLKDIVELLAAAHIGATGHHIISQGEADRILSASIRERREMIEDALGLKIYQWKKLESVRKLERTEENMKQVESLRREIAPHLKFLKKQVEKVEKAEQMRVELVTLYKEYFAAEDHYIKTEKERLSRELAAPKTESAGLERDLEKAKGILSASENKDHKSEEVISIENRLATIRREVDAATRELGVIEGEIRADERVIEKERSRMKDEEARMVYLKDVEEVVRRIEGFNIFDDAKKLWSEVVNVLREFIGKHHSVADSAMIDDAEKEIVGLKNSKSRLEKMLAELNRAETKLNREYEELKRQIEKEKDTNRDAEKDVFRIIARQNEVRGLISALTNQLDTVSRDEEAFKRELGEAAIIVGREATEYSDFAPPATKESDGRLGGREGGREPAAPRAGGDAVSRGSFVAGVAKSDRETQSFRLKQIEKIKIRLEDAGGSGGAEVMKEYRETEERNTFLGKELEDLEKAKAELLKLIAELDTRIDYEFKSGIMKINAEFQKFFALMFGGGKAELTVIKEPKRRKKSDAEELAEVLRNPEEAVDGDLSEQPEEEAEGPEGLEVTVSLPRKKVKGLVMLSGGERALTSIALLFAVSQVNPPPFIILDETDAALDEANSRKYGDMIEDLSKRSQLILITHNRETMSRAGVLYGITMSSDGASRLLSIAFEEAVKVAK
ncbi:AAA family ATPase [Patescibacteria group bacterium]|nr:AAA family ATPase [Patescibacteria group bacterium]MDE1946568.1 AAA family ATPase [Patescibacteria group bacterium]MDE2010871.1 AAA family ATPase [Patescibacteria group bacterium]